MRPSPLQLAVVVGGAFFLVSLITILLVGLAKDSTAGYNLTTPDSFPNSPDNYTEEEF
jgi:hypothetical protein